MKKILCMVGMIFVFMALYTVSVSAMTRDQAVNWAKTQANNGTKYEDSGNGGQCTDFVSAYMNYIVSGDAHYWKNKGKKDSFGEKDGFRTYNAKDYFSKSYPSGWQKISNTSDFVPQPGDILCFGANSSNTFGHVAVAIEGCTVSIMKGVGQNGAANNYAGTAAQYQTMQYFGGWGNFQGVIRPKWDSEEQPVNLGDSFYAYIINTAAWKHLTYDNDWNITSRTETGKANQIWYFSKQSDNSYKITSVKDGRCMEVHDFGKEAGTNVHMNDYSGNNAQLWYVYGKSGAYKLRAKCTDCVLDLAGNSSAEGANIQMWTSNDTPAQKFQIWKLSLPTIPKPTLKVAIDNNYINNTVFSWEPVDNAHYYDLRIMENGNIIKTIWAIKDTHYNVDLPAGNYSANIAGINDNFKNYTFSDNISFSIPNSNRPITDFNVVYENNQSIVRNNTDTQQSVAVIIAHYMDGTIKDVNIKNEIFAARETKAYSHGANAKVFVWNNFDGMKPLCKIK